MVKNNLVKKIATNLGVMALSTIIGTGICYAKEINPQGYEIPDVSKATKDLGYRYEDLTDRIEGKETRCDFYAVEENPEEEADYTIIARASVKEKIFMYEIIKVVRHPESTIKDFYAIFDEDGDGIFETKYTDKEVEKKFTEKSILPDWVLK